MKALFCILIIVAFSSCQFVDLRDESSTQLPTKPQIGTVGIFNGNIVASNFKEIGVPEFKEKIRLSIERIPFNKANLRDYNKKVQLEEKKLKIIDSIDLRPHYLKFRFSDKVGLLQALNSEENRDLKNYIQRTGKDVIMTSLMIYFPEELASAISNASEVYLVNNKKSAYSLELLNSDKTTQIIDFGEGVSFGYKFSAFCWSENQRRQPVIAAFRNKNSACPGTTKKNPEKLDRKDIFEKM